MAQNYSSSNNNNKSSAGAAGGGKKKVAPRKTVDWTTVDLSEFTKIDFTVSKTMGSATLAAVRNHQGQALEFVSPLMTCYGISWQEFDGKPSWSISLSFDESDPIHVKFRAFLDRLSEQNIRVAYGPGAQCDALVLHPKVRDPSRPHDKMAFLKKPGTNEFLRDTSRPPSVRCKVYTERNRETGAETGCLDVRLYDRKENPLFHYGDAQSDAYWAGREPPLRNWDTESQAIEKGCKVRVLMAARMSTTFNGKANYQSVVAQQIKRVAKGQPSNSMYAKPDFGNDDDVPEDDDDDEEENGGGGGGAVVKQQQQQHESAATSGKKRPVLQEMDDGVDDELEQQPPSAKRVAAAAPPVAAPVAAPAGKKSAAPPVVAAPVVADDVEEEEEQLLAAPVLPAPLPPRPKKNRTLGAAPK